MVLKQRLKNEFELMLSIYEIKLYKDRFKKTSPYFPARNQMTGGSGGSGILPCLEKRRLFARNSDKKKYV